MFIEALAGFVGFFHDLVMAHGWLTVVGIPLAFGAFGALLCRESLEGEYSPRVGLALYGAALAPVVAVTALVLGSYVETGQAAALAAVGGPDWTRIFVGTYILSLIPLLVTGPVFVTAGYALRHKT